MGNIQDYILWRGDLSLNKDKINKIDMLIMSQISMLDLAGIVPDYPGDKSITIEEASKKYFSKDSNKSMKIGLIIPDTILDMFRSLPTYKRFSKMEMSNYIDLIDEENEEQLSAVLIKLDDESYCISFSGTDDTLIGWKENLNMMFKSPIPAQLTAVEYIKKISEIIQGKLYICGHSKGGNMALYGGTHVDKEILDRVVKIYSFDGPGVSKSLSQEIEYISKINKITTIVPQASMIGRLFEHREKYKIVKSNAKGLYQHDVFSWEIIGKDFVYEEELTQSSQKVDKKIKQIIDEMTEEEKEGFSDTLYKLLSSTEAKSLLEVSTKKREILKAYFKLSKEERKYISVPIKKLLKDKDAQKIAFEGFLEFTKKNI